MTETTGERPTSSTRGVTTVLRYALFLAIVALLLGGLFIGVGDLVETQQEQAIGAQLETVGNSLAADLATTSRLADSQGTNTTVTVRTQLPATVGGSQYLIEISGSTPRYEITLRSVDPELRTTVVVRSAVAVETTTVTGGSLTLSYDETTGRVEVDDG